MGLRQMYTAETMFIDDGLTDGAMFPPSSNAVYDALQNATELPSVTADDNGDVLTVVEGEWAKATPSGGGGSLVIGVTSADDVDTFNKTWKEIHDAMASGQIAMILSEEDAYTVFQNSIAYITKDNGGNKPYRVIWLSGGDEVVFYATTENDYPSSDNGEGGGE